MNDINERDGTWTAADHCLRCGSTENLTRDHVIPRARLDGRNPLGGSNMQTLCASCNVWKSSRVLDYRNIGPVPAVRDRGRNAQDWRDHEAQDRGRDLWRAFLAEQLKPRLVYTSESPELAPTESEA